MRTPSPELSRTKNDAATPPHAAKGWGQLRTDQVAETAALGIEAVEGRAILGFRFPCGSGSSRHHNSALFAMVLSAALVIVVSRALLPASRLFPIAFASLIAV